MTFDRATTQALQAYAKACEALEAATDEAALLHLSDMRRLAALNLRKALVASGWTEPVRSRA